ncbi:MAG: carbohydrate kinase [Methylophilaceae bacterium]
MILFGEVLIDAFPDRLVLGGAPFNVARHLRAFGLNPILISRTGTDEFRNILLNAMTRFGMETIGIQCDPSHPTGQVRVHVDKDGHRFEILPDQAYDFIHPAITRMVTLSAQADLVYFGTLAQRNKTSRRALGTLLHSNGAPRMLDLNLRKPWYDLSTLKRSLANADILKVNEEELVTLAGLLRLQAADERAAAEALIRQYDLECLLVTYGEMGAWLLNKDGTEVDIEGLAGQDIADTVGAGDAFSSVFITGALSGWPVRLTLARANMFAAALCGQHGAIPEDPDFYTPFLKDWGLLQEVRIRQHS